MVYKDASSANIIIKASTMLWLISLMYNKNIKGPNIDLCGTPVFTYNQEVLHVT